jgi:hypothetical protein
MGTAHALLGVAPGNWSVQYPKYAARRDPSMNRSNPGTTSNPWPSSDIIAIAAERGFVALLLIGLAYLMVIGRALRELFRTDELVSALRALALLATAAAMLITGAFDAVMLLPVPALLVHIVLGALLPLPSREPVGNARVRTILIVALVAGIGALRSTSQVIAMGIYSTSSNSAMLRTAALIDPGNYRLHMKLARRGSGAGRKSRCRHARAAHDLFPHAAAARSLARSCS